MLVEYIMKVQNKFLHQKAWLTMSRNLARDWVVSYLCSSNIMARSVSSRELKTSGMSERCAFSNSGLHSSDRPAKQGVSSLMSAMLGILEVKSAWKRGSVRRLSLARFAASGAVVDNEPKARNVRTI